MLRGCQHCVSGEFPLSKKNTEVKYMQIHLATYRAYGRLVKRIVFEYPYNLHKYIKQLHRTRDECVSRSFRTGRLGRELQIVQLSATKCSCIAIL